MISFFRRYRTSLFIAVIAVFLIATFVGLGGYLFTSRDTTGAVASVGPAKIPYSRFAQRVNQYVEAARSRGSDVGDAEMKELKQAVLRDLIVDEILLMKAEEMGIVVTDEDLNRDIRNTPGFQRGGAFNQDLYFQAVRTAMHDTPSAYEELRRRQLKTLKLKQLIFNTAKLTPDELREAYAEAHKGSLKDFDKEKDAFAAKAHQQRALDLINYCLRQLATQVDIRSYLEQREAGT